MAQRFKAKTLLSNSGIFNDEVIAPNIADIFPKSQTIRKYAPEGLSTITSSTVLSGYFQYFPFLIKSDAVNPKICFEVVTPINPTPIRYGIYSGHNGFENAKLFYSGSINCPSVAGIYTGDINTTLKKGPYIIATSNTGVSSSSTFRSASVNNFRGIFGEPTGNSLLFGGTTTSHYCDTGSDLRVNISSGLYLSSPDSPLPALIY